LTASPRDRHQRSLLTAPGLVLLHPLYIMVYIPREGGDHGPDQCRP
jgi:hypothetical protein